MMREEKQKFNAQNVDQVRRRKGPPQITGKKWKAERNQVLEKMTMTRAELSVQSISDDATEFSLS